jgi:hypothetical protein
MLCAEGVVGPVRQIDGTDVFPIGLGEMPMSLT